MSLTENTNFALGILNQSEDERQQVFEHTKKFLENIDHDIYNFIKGTQGRSPEAGIIWIIRQLIINHENTNNDIKSSLISSFISFNNIITDMTKDINTRPNIDTIPKLSSKCVTQKITRQLKIRHQQHAISSDITTNNNAH